MTDRQEEKFRRCRYNERQLKLTVIWEDRMSKLITDNIVLIYKDTVTGRLISYYKRGKTLVAALKSW